MFNPRRAPELGRATICTDSETEFQREDVFSAAHRGQSQGLQASPSEPVGHPCAVQAESACSKEARREDLGRDKRAVGAEEEELGPMGGNPGGFHSCVPGGFLMVSELQLQHRVLPCVTLATCSLSASSSMHVSWQSAPGRGTTSLSPESHRLAGTWSRPWRSCWYQLIQEHWVSFRKHCSVWACPRCTRAHLGLCPTKLVVAPEIHRQVRLEVVGVRVTPRNN